MLWLSPGPVSFFPSAPSVWVWEKLSPSSHYLVSSTTSPKKLLFPSDSPLMTKKSESVFFAVGSPLLLRPCVGWRTRVPSSLRLTSCLVIQFPTQGRLSDRSGLRRSPRHGPTNSGHEQASGCTHRPTRSPRRRAVEAVFGPLLILMQGRGRRVKRKEEGRRGFRGPLPPAGRGAGAAPGP